MKAKKKPVKETLTVRIAPAKRRQLYRLTDDQIEIVVVLHQAQDWPR